MAKPGKSHGALLELSRAQALIAEQCAPLPVEEISLLEAEARIVGMPIIAARDQPQSDLSMMDGYALAAADAPGPLRVVFEVAAGDAPSTRALKPGEAARIFTGAPLPPGADCVAMQEHCLREGDQLVLQRSAAPLQHVRFRGDEMRAGALVLPRGARLGAAELALAATAGLARVQVYRRPRVALLSTGEELVAVGSEPKPGQLIETNSLSLSQLCREAFAEPIRLGIAKDSPRAIADMLAASDADVLVTTAGASVGEHDHAQEALELLGARIVFHGIKIRPGKPALFAIASHGEKQRLVFALPGNPAAAMLCFELLVRPALQLLQGNSSSMRPRARALLQGSLARVNGLTYFPRGSARHREGQLEFFPVAQQSSMQIGSWASANAIAVVPPGEGRIEMGEPVELMLLRLD